MRNKDKLKHILVLNRSFWPDIEATGQFVTQLCERLALKYKITVIAGRSYYVTKESFRWGRFYSRETFNGIEIIRVRHMRFWKGNLAGRIINWVTFSVLSFLVSLRIKPNIIIVGTDPPFLGIIAMMISRFKSIPFIYNCRDLFPDVALGLGKLKRGFLSRTFDYFNKKALKAARFVVPLGQSMKDRLIAKGVGKEKIRVIPDWVDTLTIKPIPKNENPLLGKFGLANKFVIMYSGNIGLSQDFSSILRALTMMKDCIYFSLVFIGEGAKEKSLKEEARLLGLKNVLFFPYQPQDMLSFSLSMADLHLIPLKKGMAATIVPSKLYGIMAVARPYLAITERESEAARLVEEFKCGLWAAAEDVKAIVDILNWAFAHPHELEKMGERGRQVAQVNFDKDIVIKEWVKILNNGNEEDI